MAGHKLLGQLLKEMELVTEGQIQEALATQRKSGGLLGDILLQLKYITKEDLRLALASQRGMELVSLTDVEIPKDVLEKVTPSFAKIYNVIPVKFENNTLTVAMADPFAIHTLDELRILLRCDVQGAVCSEEEIQAALAKYYSDKTESLAEILGDMEDMKVEEVTSPLKDSKMASHNLEEMVNAAPVIKLLNKILYQAIKDQAADIHFEPFENDFKIRYRVDGVLYEIVAPPQHLAVPLISRIKVMSNLDISETRLPQDGRIMLSVNNRPVDMRVSTLPTMYGESVVIRILDRSVVKLDLDNLGLRDDDLKLIKNLISLPHGIIIVTGPTGSGKTTTLYSALNQANDVRWKIITTEDPVEYDLDGIVQCQINDDIGVNYASLLRSILRQDPDMILVGEIRDLETAEIAVEASLTGHVVLSTLHTNDAPSAITRLLDLGVEPYLICSTLEAIVAQRLVRRICSKCKEEMTPTEEMLMELGLLPDDVQGKKLCWGKGCDTCNNTGYRGRLAIYENMLLTERVKEQIIKGSSTDSIRQVAREEGMRTLRESGLLAIYDGHTTIEEVVRETFTQ